MGGCPDPGGVGGRYGHRAVEGGQVDGHSTDGVSVVVARSSVVPLGGHGVTGLEGAAHAGRSRQGDVARGDDRRNGVYRGIVRACRCCGTIAVACRDGYVAIRGIDGASRQQMGRCPDACRIESCHRSAATELGQIEVDACDRCGVVVSAGSVVPACRDGVTYLERSACSRGSCQAYVVNGDAWRVLRPCDREAAEFEVGELVCRAGATVPAAIHIELEAFEFLATEIGKLGCREGERFSWRGAAVDGAGRDRATGCQHPHDTHVGELADGTIFTG